MLKRLVIAGIVVVLAVVSLAPMAGATVDRFEVPITGDRFDCDGTEYTISQGSIEVVVKEGMAAQGNSNLAVSVRPRGTLVDSDGGEFKLVGAESFHISTNVNSGGMVVQQVFHVVIVSSGSGGVVGRVAETFHLTLNQNNVTEVNVSLGNCEGPFSD